MATNQIRDSRSKDWFYLDNEILEVFGGTGKGEGEQGIGIHALGVYMALAKHANNDTQQCKPSYQTIATILGVSRNTVITAIKTLEKAGIIAVEQRNTVTDNKKIHTTNIYTLKNIKASEPIPTSEPPSVRTAPPSARDGIGVVQEVNHPSAPEVPELNYLDNTNSDYTIPPPTPKAKLSEKPLVVDERVQLRKQLKTLLPANQQSILSQATEDKLKQAVEKYPLDWVRKGFDIAATATTVHRLNYFLGTLDHWERHGLGCVCSTPKSDTPTHFKQPAYSGSSTRQIGYSDAPLINTYTGESLAGEGKFGVNYSYGPKGA